jgi:hypothetical protein
MPLPLGQAQDLSTADIAVNSLQLLKATAPNITNVLGNTLVLTSARTLLANESGATAIWNHATGFIITLPAPVVGMKFRFKVGVTVTTPSHKLITNASSVFLLGSVQCFVEDTTPAANPGPKDFLFNGTTHVACTMSGTTTGGIIGTWIEVEALNATQWLITGLIKASGTIATPAATS